MADGLTILITGASKGLGKGLATSYLTHPSTTVIAAVRTPSDPGPQSLLTHPKHPSATLIILPLEATSPASIAAAIRTLQTDHAITHLDLVVANAGNSVGVGALSTIDPATTIQQNIDVNAYGPLWLLQATLPLLRAAPRQPPVFAAMSSFLGSGALLAESGKAPLGAYGVSKALLNAIVRRVAVEEEGVVVLALDPGSVGTDLTWRTIRSLGMDDFEHISVEESVAGLTKVLAEATKKTSGRFMKYTGEETPW